MTNPDSIIVENLTKRFGDFTAVDAINFRVPEGTIFGFLGANGAGKSTAIRMMCGLLEPTGGRAIVAGYDVLHETEKVKQSIGYMSQRFSLYEDITVRENIRFFGGVYGLRGSRLAERTKWVLETADLMGNDRRLTKELPGGVKQRLALGCALIHEPKIVFLDEPTGGVDPLSRRAFWELIQDLAAGGTTVLVTTHFLDEAEYCHQIALIDAGKIVANGSPGALKRDYLPYSILGLNSDDPLKTFGLLQNREFIREISLFGLSLHLGVDEPESAMIAIRTILSEQSIRIENLEIIMPSLEDVFIHLISNRNPRS